MSSARDEILRRIRTALADKPAPPPVERTYRQAAGADTDQPAEQLVEQFAERVADYRATVHRHTTIDAILTSRAITRIVVPDGLPDELLPSNTLPSITLIHEPVDIDTLDDVSAVVTTCAIAIAETGTIVLDTGAGQGPRALTLVPDYHLVIVRPDQIRAIVPDAIAALDPTRPLTWISGPSATSDIELNRVEGVHGPRTLDVLITD